MRKQNGITLVSLVITIIVMLILAGVALSMIMGDSSVLDQAITAVDETENQGEIERTKMAVLGSFDRSGQYDSSLAFDNIQKQYNLKDVSTSEVAGKTIVRGTNTETGEEIELTREADGKITVLTKDYKLEFDNRGKETNNIKLDGSGNNSGQLAGTTNNTNNHGFYFDKKYNSVVNGDKTTIIFSEDTSAKMFVNDVLNMDIPAGMIIYGDKKIDLSALNYGMANVSDDGKNINIGGAIFVLEAEIVPDALDKKYYLPRDMGGYLIISEDNTINVYDDTNIIIMTIPSDCVAATGNGFVLSGTGDYDGGYEFCNNEQFIIQVVENNEAYVLGFDDSFVCTHKKRTDLNGKTDGKNYWRSFYDENDNALLLSSITHISKFKNYKLRCDFCHEELEFVQEGNYLYIYNSWMEPQRINGMLLPTLCVDIDDEELGGWMAIPFDCAQTSGLLTTVKGKPVTAIYFSNNMYIPKHTKYLLTWPSPVTVDENIAPQDYSITYEGTINEFKQMKNVPYSQKTLEEELKSMSNNYQSDKITSFTVKCSDGDLKIK